MCGHSPVMMVERDGEQMGALTYAFSKTKLSSLKPVEIRRLDQGVAVAGHRVGPLLVREYEEQVWSFGHQTVPLSAKPHTFTTATPTAVPASGPALPFLS